MKLDLVARNYKVGDKLKDLIEKKVSKLEKFFDKPVKVKVVCTKNKDRERMEVSLSSGSTIIRSEVETDNMFANLDICLARIEKQIIKYAGKLEAKRQNGFNDFEFYDEEPEVKLPKITKRKEFTLEPMTEEDALIQMDLVGNDFFVFMNSEIGKVCLLYKRADGGIGFIETK